MKRGTPRHPKVYDLMAALDIKCRPLAIGILEMLWHFTSEFAPQGDIGRYSDDRIEGALDWTGRAGRLVEALTTSGWVDIDDRFRLVTHDWADHCDDSVKKRLSRAGLQFVVLTAKVTGHFPPMSGNPAGQCPPALALALPEPQPEPHPPVTPSPPKAKAQTSERFSEFWKLWPRKQHKDAACRLWISAVTVEQEPEVFACLARFLQSGDVARGILPNPENWLLEQSRDRWQGEWPAPSSKSPPAAPYVPPEFYSADRAREERERQRRINGLVD